MDCCDIFLQIFNVCSGWIINLASRILITSTATKQKIWYLCVWPNICKTNHIPICCSCTFSLVQGSKCYHFNSLNYYGEHGQCYICSMLILPLWAFCLVLQGKVNRIYVVKWIGQANYEADYWTLLCAGRIELTDVNVMKCPGQLQNHYPGQWLERAVLMLTLSSKHHCG